MKQKLLFVLDLGHFKAFRIINDEKSPQPRVVPLESFEPTGSHGRMADKLTDQAGGRFGTGSGERHNIPLEFERRTIQLLADRLIAICRKQPELPLIYLAAQKEINHPIVDRLPSDLRNNIEKNIMDDLVKVHQTDLLGHFRRGKTAGSAAALAAV